MSTRNSTIVALARAHRLLSAAEDACSTSEGDEICEFRDDAWLKRAELLMAPEQVKRWDALCRDFRYGKPGAKDVREYALAVLRGEPK